MGAKSTTTSNHPSTPDQTRTGAFFQCGVAVDKEWTHYFLILYNLFGFYLKAQ